MEGGRVVVSVLSSVNHVQAAPADVSSTATLSSDNRTGGRENTAGPHHMT